MTGTVASESDGLVYGLTNRGVKPEWFVGLGGRIEGDASCPGAKYRSADGRILEFRRKRNGLGFWIEFQGVDGKATHDVDFCIARVTGKEPSSTAISTIDDLPYIYIDKDQRLFVNLKAREGRVRVDPRTGLMLEGE